MIFYHTQKLKIKFKLKIYQTVNLIKVKIYYICIKSNS